MSSQYEMFSHFQALVTAAHDELEGADNDRARVLLGGALLDQCLTLTLRAFLADCDETAKLLDPLNNGALSTFAAKVMACVSLGLLPKDESRICKDLATIRNTYAHQVEASFSQKFVSLLENAEKGLRLGHPETISFGGRYQVVCGTLVAWMAQRWSAERLRNQRQVEPSNWFHKEQTPPP